MITPEEVSRIIDYVEAAQRLTLNDGVRERVDKDAAQRALERIAQEDHSSSE